MIAANFSILDMTTRLATSGRHPNRGSAGRIRLPAKLSRPRQAGVVDRPRLFALIDAQRERPLLWISGPPGAGKTTLVTSYLERKGNATLWYRVDGGDSDAATFFSFLAQGARALGPDRKIDLLSLTPEYLLDLAGFARRFFRSLFGSLPASATVVLDGYEAAPGGTLDSLLATAVDEVPPGSRLIIASRSVPPPALVHLTIKGALAIISAEDLQLVLDEARTIAANTPGAMTAPVESLLAQCDGWMAGFVVMLADARRSAAADPRAVGALHESLFAYFATEMFRHADDATRELLVRTVLMPAFSETQAQALCPRIDAVSIIRRLYDQHYFINRGPGPDPLYRYHALFRGFLRQQSASLLSPGQRQELLVQGAALLAADGREEDAVALYIDASSWDDAGRLICGIAPSRLAQGRNAWLDKNISALPQTMVERVPWLGYWLGMARLPFAPPIARAELERAYRRFEALDDSAGCLLCCAGVLDTYWLEWVDMRPIDRWGAIAASVVAKGDAFPDDDLRIRILSASAGLGFRAQAHAGVVRMVIDQAFDLLKRIEDPAKRVVL
ncbi:MAG: hypothetical protein JNK22_15025, partial [Rhodocyclaceae bacterium]|nr:hypothetical protein [Rhodocyclaceae bacterium]